MAAMETSETRRFVIRCERFRFIRSKAHPRRSPFASDARYGQAPAFTKLTMRTFLPLIFMLLVLFNGRAGDATGYTTPASGTPIRKELMDALRLPVERHLGQPIIFKVSTLRVSDGWAFFVGNAMQPNGKPVDYRKSQQFKTNPKDTQMDMKAGLLFGGVDALLRREGDRWKIVTITYDAGDVHWLDYDKRFGAPRRMIADPLK